jgi:hypothetical protein
MIWLFETLFLQKILNIDLLRVENVNWNMSRKMLNYLLRIATSFLYLVEGGVMSCILIVGFFDKFCWIYEGRNSESPVSTLSPGCLSNRLMTKFVASMNL